MVYKDAVASQLPENLITMKESAKRDLLVILSYSYPYGTAESFLATELPFLKDVFSRIVILPMTKDGSNQIRTTEKTIKVLQPLLKDRTIFSRLIYLFCACKSINIVIKALRKSVTSAGFKFSYSFLKRALIAATISGATYSRLKPYFKTNPIIYSYWGNNSASVLPFIPEHCPKICRFHGIDLYAERECNSGFMPLQRDIIKAVNLVALISNHGLRYLQNKFPAYAQKMEVFYLGVDSFSPNQPTSNSTFKILTCSALSRVKRLSVLVEALSLCNIPVEWTHIGSGNEETLIRNACFKIPKNISVNLKGQLTNLEVKLFYKDNPIDLFINISASEGLPVSIMEALSAGIPVLAGNVGGIKEIVTPATGWLLPPAPDAKTVAQKINYIAKLPAQEFLDRKISARKEWENKWNAKTNFSEFALRITRLKNLSLDIS